MVEKTRGVVDRLRPHSAVFCFTGTPSHRPQKDVDDGVLTPTMKHLNEGADALATIAKRSSAPPGDIVACALRGEKDHATAPAYACCYPSPKKEG